MAKQTAEMLKKRAIRERLKKRGMTGFQIKVLLATYSIPKGGISTYKWIARKIGHPNAYRAVGTALKNNPMAPIIPCHRVIKSDGAIGNYSRLAGTKSKTRILKREHAI